jgi:hypothetical protein
MARPRVDLAAAVRETVSSISRGKSKNDIHPTLGDG